MVVVIGVLVALVVASYVGDALAPTLVTEQPWLLILLNARIRYLVLTVNQLDPLTFYGIGFFRNVLSDPLFYLLGFWYGTAAVRWMEQRTRSVGQMLGGLERIFARWGAPLVFIAPNNPVCLLAGAAGMRPVVFVALNVSGTIARLIGIAIFGEAFEAPIEWVLDVITRFRIPLLLLSIGAVAFTVWNESRKGTSQIDQLRDLERGLVDDEDQN